MNTRRASIRHRLLGTDVKSVPGSKLINIEIKHTSHTYYRYCSCSDAGSGSVICLFYCSSKLPKISISISRNIRKATSMQASINDQGAGATTKQTRMPLRCLWQRSSSLRASARSQPRPIFACCWFTTSHSKWPCARSQLTIVTSLQLAQICVDSSQSQRHPST